MARQFQCPIIFSKSRSLFVAFAFGGGLNSALDFKVSFLTFMCFVHVLNLSAILEKDLFLSMGMIFESTILEKESFWDTGLSFDGIFIKKKL